MKTISNILLALLGSTLLLFLVIESRAMPPLRHAVSGVIVEIDYAAHTITVAPTKGEKPMIFVWNDSTRFSQGRNEICPGALESGQPVKIHYRREYGRLVPYQVSLLTQGPTSCLSKGAA